ncbi:MAG: peptidoglycan-binding protein [Patescibacteria group bacterium]|nr:peptidoglycan-binding protein [Patescibacteria group bacterium]
MHLPKNSRFLSVVIGTVFAVSIIGNAPVAKAAALSSVQIQAILNLLQAFNADASTIANVQAALENTGTSTPVTNGSGSSEGSSNTSNGCAVLSSNLQVGSTDQTTGGEVSRLQAFLGKDKNIYPEDSVTGYFGSATQAAVERWQAAQGIVSSGNPETTGYGVIGPRTRGEMDKEMEVECENGGSSSSSDSTASSTATTTESHSSGSEGN